MTNPPDQQIGDIEVFVHEGKIHLFHLMLPAHHHVAHWVSEDALHWRQLPHALSIGPQGAPDDGQIWTMSVFKWKDGFRMLYTALTKHEKSFVQRVSTASSRDLITWKKHPEVIVEPDSQWYVRASSLRKKRAFRDPFPWVVDKTVHMLVTAHDKIKPVLRGGCVAHYSSRDAIHWKAHPPLYSPDRWYDCEVPALYKIGKYHWLFFGGRESVEIRVARARDWRGPYRQVSSSPLLPPWNYAGRCCRFQGRWLLFHWYRQPPSIHNAVLTGYGYNHPKQRYVFCLPKELRETAAGCLEPLRFHGISQLHKGKPRLATGSHSQIVDGPGLKTKLLSRTFKDFEWTVTIQRVNGVAAGLVLRSDQAGVNALWLRWRPDAAVLELVRWVRHHPKIGGKIFDWEPLQTVTLPQSPSSLQVTVMLWGQHIQVAIGQRVVMNAGDWERTSGRVGMFVEDGSAIFFDHGLTQLQPPTSWPR